MKSKIEIESFEYKGIMLQRINQNYFWYAIENNKIINYGQYRHDLMAWIDNEERKANMKVKEICKIVEIGV